jgi:tRNA A-37 threonylcarbamoyl transferase component Bud32
MGIALKLRGFEDIGAGWSMVIMDALHEEYKPFNRNALPAGTHEHIRAGLDELHRAHFVHGDLRDANILVRQGGGKPGFMLVDFDWAGVHQQNNIRFMADYQNGNRLLSS